MPLLVSALVQVPTVVGWLRPVVLVPVGALGGLPAEHLEALLLHELAHIRRHDYLVNILQSVAEALLFYHPAVWWVSGHIRAERELCCDDVAVSVSAMRSRMRARWRIWNPTVRRISVPRWPPMVDPWPTASQGCWASSRPAVRTGLGPGCRVTIAVLLATAVYGLFGQSGAHPAFEWRPSNEMLPTRTPRTAAWALVTNPAARMIATNAPLRLLIQFAYAAHDSPYRVTQLPCGLLR